MKSLQALLLITFLATSYCSLSSTELGAFCRPVESDPNHADYITSTCNLTCTEHETHVIGGQVLDGQVCSFDLTDWCGDNTCRHQDRSFLAESNGLAYKAINQLNISETRYELCFMPHGYSLADTPLANRSTCHKCTQQYHITTMEGEWNHVKITCGVMHNVQLSNILLETYAPMLDEPDVEVMDTASFYALPNLLKADQRLDYVSFDNYERVIKVNQTTDVDIKGALIFVFKDI